MKKLALLVLVLTLLLCACSSKENSGNTHPSAKTAVSMGYSLDQLQLNFAGEKSNLVQQKKKYDSTVNVNGDYTELYTSTQGGRVSVMKLQGFYREDLKAASVFINNRVYSEKQLKDNIVYQNDAVLVLDISQMVYQDSLGKRIQNLGLDAEKETNMIQIYSRYANNIGSLIQKANPSQDQPQLPQNRTEAANNINL